MRTRSAIASRPATTRQPPAPRPRRRAALVLLGCALALALAVPRAARAQGAESGVQITPDGQRTLVSKDVGGQRWAITRDLQDGTVTGNVFEPGGGPASFVWCAPPAGPAPAPGADVTLSCYGAVPCEAAPCTADAWTFIADVALPAAFFAPPGSDANVVPTSSAELFAYVQSGVYRAFAAESGVHPSAGPHGGSVRTFVNDVLAGSLAAGGATHPAGAAAVKELYAADRTTLTGWAVEVKAAPDSDGGRGWYWYEVFSTSDGSRPIEGFGNASCTGCHAQGLDYVRIPYPLQ